MKYIWIVGASSGIGEALVRQLENPDCTIFISARNEQKLLDIAQASSNKLIVLPLDVCDETTVNRASAHIQSITNALDQVIINAGTCEYIDSNKIDISVVKNIMNTNFFGALNIVNAALPMLRHKIQLASNAKTLPQLVFMSSSVAYQALPRAGAYGSSKVALRYFAECLKLDLQHEGVDVRVISPGFVKTPLTDKNDFPMPFRVSAEQASSRIQKGLKSKHFDIAFPRKFTSLLKFISILPDTWRFKLVGKSSRHNKARIN